MILFRIASELGGYTVDELGDRISALEVTEWIAFFNIQKAELKRQTSGGSTDD